MSAAIKTVNSVAPGRRRAAGGPAEPREERPGLPRRQSVFFLGVSKVAKEVKSCPNEELPQELKN